ncbi:MAG: class I adenylate-forming enzyme family protein [Chryseolinea sp.]
MSSSTSNVNVYHTLVAASTTWPNNIAIVDEYGAITFAELYQQTEQLKTKLINQGLGYDQGIGLLIKNNRYFLIGLYAGIGCGAVVMPISPQQKPEEINNATREAKLHYLLSDRADLYTVKKESHEIKHIDQFLFLSNTNRNPEEKTIDFIEQPAVMRFTSGTTGEAKCVVLSHRSVIERIEAANEGLRLNHNDRVVWVLPMAYHFIVSIMLYVQYGVGIIICSDFLAESILENIRKYSGTLLYASPMHIRLLASYAKDVSIPSLKRVISTTTSISTAICAAFKSKYRLPVMQAFGIIEVGLPIINIDRSEDHPEAVGYSLPAYTIAILDESLNLLSSNETGLLAIKGPGMFDGYLSPVILRDSVLKNGWFITGDTAIRSTDGLIEIKGRRKVVINVSGNKVFPTEVENVLNTYPGISLSKVYGQAHALLGEVVVADLILENRHSFQEEALLSHCHKMLSSFKVPHRINIVDHIEMTDSGKIKR